MIGGNPMDYFQMGRAGGAARSPVMGIGSAIRGILEQSKSMGLLQAQSTYQAQGSNAVNIAKENREIAANPGRNKLNVIGRGTVKTYDIEPGSHTATQPATTQTMAEKIAELTKLKEQNQGAPTTPDSSLVFATIEEANAAADAGLIKSGDRIQIGTVPGVWE